MFIAQYKETKEPVEVFDSNIRSTPEFLIYDYEKEKYVWVDSNLFEPLRCGVKLNNQKKI